MIGRAYDALASVPNDALHERPRRHRRSRRVERSDSMVWIWGPKRGVVLDALEDVLDRRDDGRVVLAPDALGDRAQPRENRAWAA